MLDKVVRFFLRFFLTFRNSTRLSALDHTSIFRLRRQFILESCAAVILRRVAIIMLDRIGVRHHRRIVQPLYNLRCQDVGYQVNNLKYTAQITQIVKHTIGFSLVLAGDRCSAQKNLHQFSLGQRHTQILESHDLLLLVHLKKTHLLLVQFENVPNIILQTNGALHIIDVFFFVQFRLNCVKSVEIRSIGDRFFLVGAKKVWKGLHHIEIHIAVLRFEICKALVSHIAPLDRDTDKVKVCIAVAASHIQRFNAIWAQPLFL